MFTWTHQNIIPALIIVNLVQEEIHRLDSINGK